MLKRVKIMSLEDILSGLSSAAGVSGAEGSAARLAMELLSDYASVTQDALGSVTARLGGARGKEHILLEAHIDEVGLIVTQITPEGFLRVAAVGGIDRRALLGAEVCVLGERKLAGVICCKPPHLSRSEDYAKAPEISTLAVDIGLGFAAASQLVPLGSRVVMRAHPLELLGGRFSCKALDNRAGVAAVIRTVELLAQGRTPECGISVLLGTREETGLSAAKCAAFELAPSQALVIDVTPAAQIGSPCCCELGGGPVLCHSPVLDYAMSEKLNYLAQLNAIALQHEVCGGRTSTDADAISLTGGGVRTAVLSVPVRNMHTPTEICELSDIEQTARLAAAFIGCGGDCDA